MEGSKNAVSGNRRCAIRWSVGSSNMSTRQVYRQRGRYTGNRQRGRYTGNRQRGRHTGNEAGIQATRQAYRQRGRHTGNEAGIQATGNEAGIQATRQAYRQRGRHTGNEAGIQGQHYNKFPIRYISIFITNSPYFNCLNKFPIYTSISI